MALWSELPGDLLREINGHLGRYFDKIRFTCVCTFWQSELPKLSKLPDLPLRQPQPPWLLLPYKTGSMCGLYDPLENKLIDIDLPEAGEKVFKGTGHGWVVTQQLNGSIDVLNPLTRVRVPLPPRYKFPDVLKYDPDNIGEEYLIESNNGLPYAASSTEVRDSTLMEKVVLSSSPLSDDFIAVAVFSFCRLAYCKVGDSEWRYLVEFDEELDEDTPCDWYKDATFLGGKLYAITRGREIMVCDDIRSCTRLRKCEVPPFTRQFDRDYDKLVNSSDSLVMVRRTKVTREIEMEDGDYEYVWYTVGLEMYRLDVDADTTTGWIRIKSLDDDEILFMGLGTHILFSSHDFIGKGNRIYFASDRLDPDHGDIENCFDNGVFDFEDGRFKPLDYECNPHVIWPSPIWFTPSLY